MDILIKAFMATTPLEWACNIVTLICIILAGQNSVHTWWTGIVGCILFGVLFYQYGLYADTVLQIFFVVTSILGWSHWASTKGKPAAPLKMHIPGSTIGIVVAVSVLAYTSYVYMLSTYTDASLPEADTAVLVLSVIGQILLMRRYVHAWPVWLAVNTIAVPLFFYKELYITTIMYAFFLMHAIYAWYHWYKLYIEQEKYVSIS